MKTYIYFLQNHSRSKYTDTEMRTNIFTGLHHGTLKKTSK